MLSPGLWSVIIPITTNPPHPPPPLLLLTVSGDVGLVGAQVENLLCPPEMGGTLPHWPHYTPKCRAMMPIIPAAHACVPSHDQRMVRLSPGVGARGETVHTHLTSCRMVTELIP